MPPTYLGSVTIAQVGRSVLSRRNLSSFRRSNGQRVVSAAVLTPGLMFKWFGSSCSIGYCGFCAFEFCRMVELRRAVGRHHAESWGIEYKESLFEVLRWFFE